MEGAYNLRVIEYANGTVQIRKYSTPVNAVFDAETSVTPVYQKPKRESVQKCLILLRKNWRLCMILTIQIGQRKTH